jgi:hypothetical protein
VIPDEAVEAAAKALDPHTMGSAGQVAEKFKEATRAEARRALESAAPYLMAEAWDEGVLIGFDEGQGARGRTPNPYRSAGAGE